MAGSCTLAAVALKHHHGARFVFSEHGMYLREAYLREASDRGSPFLKLLKLGFARRMSELSYASADQISTCCDYNKRWQTRIGASPDRVTTVYYGLDPDDYGPQDARAAPIGPVVVWMGRIDPIKDLETLLRAAADRPPTAPDVVFRLYGAPEPGNVWYYQHLLDLRAELGLEAVVAFRGLHRRSPVGLRGRRRGGPQQRLRGLPILDPRGDAVRQAGGGHLGRRRRPSSSASAAYSSSPATMPSWPRRCSAWSTTQQGPASWGRPLGARPRPSSTSTCRTSASSTSTRPT